MATITGYTAERMKQIEDQAIVDGEVVSGNLFLYPKNYPVGAAVNAGSVIGPTGPQGDPGEVTEATVDTKIATAIAPLAGPTSCRVNRTLPFGVAHNVNTIMASWISESWDTGSMHSDTLNPSRLTIPAGRSGIYQLSINFLFSPEVVATRERSGTRLVRILKNNATIETFQHDPGTPFTNYYISNTINLYLLEGNYIEIGLYQFTGIWQNVSGSFSLHRLGN